MRTLAWCVAAGMAVSGIQANAAWHEAQSKHFIIYADSNPKQLQADCAALDEVTKPLAELLMDKVTEAMLRKRGLV